MRQQAEVELLTFSQIILQALAFRNVAHGTNNLQATSAGKSSYAYFSRENRTIFPIKVTQRHPMGIHPCIFDVFKMGPCFFFLGADILDF